jgi:hypothetical protein
MEFVASQSDEQEERRPYVSPVLTHHENWQIVTGTPISGGN